MPVRPLLEDLIIYDNVNWGQLTALANTLVDKIITSGFQSIFEEPHYVARLEIHIAYLELKLAKERRKHIFYE